MGNVGKPGPRESATVRWGMRFVGVLLLVLSPYAIRAGHERYREGRDSVNWPQTSGEVYAHREYDSLRRAGDCSVYILYRYFVDGKGYTGERVYPGQGTISHEERDQLLAMYPIESRPAVFYAPSDPARSFLEPR